jgi:hypothetical protein
MPLPLLSYRIKAYRMADRNIWGDHSYSGEPRLCCEIGLLSQQRREQSRNGNSDSDGAGLDSLDRQNSYGDESGLRDTPFRQHFPLEQAEQRT